jgi:hypothetical protein
MRWPPSWRQRRPRASSPSRDIFDISGIKLWARDMPVSQALQRKLLDRQLRNPLESCLMAEDGVTTATLVEASKPCWPGLRRCPLLKPHAAKLVQEAEPAAAAGGAAAADRWPGFPPRVLRTRAAGDGAVNGALMLAHGGTRPNCAWPCWRPAARPGRDVHRPALRRSRRRPLLDFQSYQQLVVHPHVGQLLITQLTDYPKALARGVAEHHERLDGSGYPHALRRDAVSPLGCMLAVSEAALAALRLPQAEMARASVSLRVVPGEFDLTWVGRIADAARMELPPHERPDAAAVQSRLGRLDAALQATQGSAEALGLEAETPDLKAALALALHLLGRLRTGWFASGLWSQEALAEQDLAEAASVEDELSFRLRTIERAAQLRAGELPAADAQRLDLFCTGLRTAAGH